MTTRPGARLRAFAARVCSEAALRRWIDPVIAYLQYEHDELLRHGRRWRAPRGAPVAVAGHNTCLALASDVQDATFESSPPLSSAASICGWHCCPGRLRR